MCIARYSLPMANRIFIIWYFVGVDSCFEHILQSVILPQIKHNKNTVKKMHRSYNRWMVGYVYVARR